MRLSFFFIVLFSISCTKRQDKIVIPTVTSGFYSQALLKIDNNLKGNEDNLHLVEQKLYYCDYLDWPVTCISALDELKRQKGMTPQLLDQYVLYYRIHNKYEQMMDVIDRWGDEFELKEAHTMYRILALSKLSRKEEATILIRSYMKDKLSFDDLKFASERFIEMEDTLMASYYLGKLMRLDSTNDLVFNNYSYFLMDLGFEQQAFTILERYAGSNSDDYDFHSSLSQLYENAGRFSEARDKLKHFTDIDSVVYRIADSYIYEKNWDSAHFYIDKIVERDSANRDAWLKKAVMYENQGWLTYSLNYFDHVVYLNPADTAAIKSRALVSRKIAYLQRKKFERNQLPLPVIKSKKLIDNE